MRGIRIGQILVEQGLLTQSQADHILAVQKRSGRPFGDLAERLFGLNPKAVEDAWSAQYATIAPQPDLDLVAVDADCTRLLNRRQAWQFHVVPIYREQDELVLITDKDHLIRAINFAAATFKESVYVKIAPTEALRDVLQRIYPVPQHIADYAADKLTHRHTVPTAVA
jgi:hypothetical protein